MIKKGISLMMLGILITTNIVFAQDILDYVDYLGEGQAFGYDKSEKIQITDINNQSITIKSPVIIDEFEEVISTYVAMYSEYPLNMLVEDPELLQEELTEIEYANVSLSSDDFTIDLYDNKIKEDEIYYVFLAPKNEIGEIGNISNELCFVLDQQIKGEGDECELLYNDGGNHNAGADMNLAKITDVVDNIKITLSRLAIDGTDQIDLFLFNENSEEWEFLDTVDMLDEEYKFEATHYGSHTILFKPTDGGTEVSYTLNVLAPDKKDKSREVNEPKIPVVPSTGPAENLALIIIISIIGYFVYRVLRTKKAK